MARRTRTPQESITRQLAKQIVADRDVTLAALLLTLEEWENDKALPTRSIIAGTLSDILRSNFNAHTAFSPEGRIRRRSIRRGWFKFPEGEEPI